MINIGQPYVSQEADSASLCAEVSLQGLKIILKYTVENEYSRFLCYELSDAFLIAVLPIAIKLCEDIELAGPVSSKLLFNINNSILFLHNFIQGANRTINIKATSRADIHFDSKGVGCGCSLGVDSLAAIYRHSNSSTQPDYKLTHLALFNCGQMGDRNHKAARTYFEQATLRMQSFAKEMNLPTVAIESNINELYEGMGVGIVASVNMRTISCAMSLQKLFAKYIFASSYRLDQIRFIVSDEEFLEGFIVPNLSSNNLEIVLSCADMTRVEKEEYIDKNVLTHKYLNVCCAEQLAYGGGGGQWVRDKSKINCGWCDKCMRTLLAYEVLGKLDAYKNIFDLEKYHKHKALYIRHAFVNDKVKPFANELVELMLKNDYPIPRAVKLQYIAKQLVRNIQEKINYVSYRIVRRLNRGVSRY